jgi:hypothetical protein
MLREEHRLRVPEDRALRRIFGPERDEVTGDLENCIMRKFKICDLHQTAVGPSNQRRMRWTGHAARIGKMRNAYNTVVRKPEGKIPLGRSRHGW